MDLGQQLRSLVTENLNLKLLSLAFALRALLGRARVAGGAAIGRRPAQRRRPASRHAQPRAHEPIPEKMQRHACAGRKSTLDDLNADDLGSVQLDLRSGTDTRVLFDPSMIPVPPGLRVERDRSAGDRARSGRTWSCGTCRSRSASSGTPAPGYVVKGAPGLGPGHGARARTQEPGVVAPARPDRRLRRDGAHRGQVHAGAGDRPAARARRYSTCGASARRVEIGREVVERPFTKLPLAVVGRTNARRSPAEVDVRLSCPSDVARALRREQIVPRVRGHVDRAEHGSDVLPVQRARSTSARCTSRRPRWSSAGNSGSAREPVTSRVGVR